MLHNKYAKNLKLFYIQSNSCTLAFMKLQIILFYLFISTFGVAQTKSETPVLIDNFVLYADKFIGYDKFDFLYSVKDNTLYKSKNNEIFSYKNLALGQITKVDLLNPLKIIVFYERFNTAITLDNQLNETLKINFSELKTPLVVNKIGIASQNQLWIFDEILQQLYLYNTTNGAARPVGTPVATAIKFYNSDFNYFEWFDGKNNYYQCSIFGTVEKIELPIEFDNIVFSNSEILIFQKNDNTFIFNRKNQKYTIVENIDKSFKSLTYKNQILSIFTNQGISNYKITIP